MAIRLTTARARLLQAYRVQAAVLIGSLAVTVMAMYYVATVALEAGGRGIFPFRFGTDETADYSRDAFMLRVIGISAPRPCRAAGRTDTDHSLRDPVSLRDAGDRANRDLRAACAGRSPGAGFDPSNPDPTRDAGGGGRNYAANGSGRRHAPADPGRSSNSGAGVDRGGRYFRAR